MPDSTESGASIPMIFEQFEQSVQSLLQQILAELTLIHTALVTAEKKP